MDETGQPGAATPGENGNGAVHGGELARPANGWTPSDPGWSDREPSGSGEAADPGPRRWRQPVERPSWADPAPRFQPAPAVTGAAPNGERPRNGSINDRFERRSSLTQSRHPASGPPAYGEDRSETGPDRLAMPAPRPGPEPARPFSEPPAPATSRDAAPATGRDAAAEAARHAFDESTGQPGQDGQPGQGQNDPGAGQPPVVWYRRQGPERAAAPEPDEATPTGYEPPPGFRSSGYDPRASRLSVPAQRPPAPEEQGAWPRRRPAEPIGVPAPEAADGPADQEQRGLEEQRGLGARGLTESRGAWAAPAGPADQAAAEPADPAPAAGESTAGWSAGWGSWSSGDPSPDGEREPSEPQPNSWATAWPERAAVRAADGEPATAPDLPDQPGAETASGSPETASGSPEDRPGLGGRDYPTRDEATAHSRYEGPVDEVRRRPADAAGHPSLSDPPRIGATGDWSELPSGPVDPAADPPVPAPALPAYPPALPAYPPPGGPVRPSGSYGTARPGRAVGDDGVESTGYPPWAQPAVDRVAAPDEGRPRPAWSEPSAALPPLSRDLGDPRTAGSAGSADSTGSPESAGPGSVAQAGPGRFAPPPVGQPASAQAEQPDDRWETALQRRFPTIGRSERNGTGQPGTDDRAGNPATTDRVPGQERARGVESTRDQPHRDRELTGEAELARDPEQAWEAERIRDTGGLRGREPAPGSGLGPDPGVAARLAAQLRPAYPHRPVETAVQGDPTPSRRVDPLLDVLPQRIPAEPDVPIVPEPPAVEPPAETPELARIATHLRREDAPSTSQDRPDGFDVQAILAAVRGVAGVWDASLRTTAAGAHSLRLDLSDGADPADVSRQVARLLQDRMGLAAAPQELTGVAEAALPVEDRSAGPAQAGSASIGSGRTGPGDGAQDDTGEMPVPRRRRQPAAHRGRATVGDRGAPPVPSGTATAGFPASTAPLAGTSYAGGQQLTTTESAPSRPLNPDGPPGPRVIIDQVQVSTFGLEATVEVGLAAAERRATGLTTGPAVDGYVLRLCAASAASAVDELLRSVDPTSERGRCFVEHAAVLPFGSCEVATVVVLLVCDGWVEQLAGSALVSGDPRQAIVRATLAAVNRRLEALLA